MNSMAMNDCYYGLDSCVDHFIRECGCVGCWVIAPPEYLLNIKIVEHILRFVPHAIIDDTIQFDIDHLPTNELIFELILKGFKVLVPEYQHSSLTEKLK